MKQELGIEEVSSNKTGGCGCGCSSPEVPILDVRTIPHAIRHASIHGAFEAIKPGSSLILIAPHAPRPLLRELADRGPIQVEYLEEGPEEWRLQITRL